LAPSLRHAGVARGVSTGGALAVFHHGEALCESPLSECSYEDNGANGHGFERVI
jgi:hypothetical protein